LGTLYLEAIRQRKEVNSMEDFASWMLRRTVSAASPIVKEHLRDISEVGQAAEIIWLAELGARVVKFVRDGEKVPS
jgi:hypothetical protein